MPVRMNRMKQKLRQGQPVFGGLLRTPNLPSWRFGGRLGMTSWFSRRARPGKSSIRAGGR